jgi:uncharacterized protein with PIN domain
VGAQLSVKDETRRSRLGSSFLESSSHFAERLLFKGDGFSKTDIGGT